MLFIHESHLSWINRRENHGNQEPVDHATSTEPSDDDEDTEPANRHFCFEEEFAECTKAYQAEWYSQWNIRRNVGGYGASSKTWKWGSIKENYRWETVPTFNANYSLIYLHPNQTILTY